MPLIDEEAQKTIVESITESLLLKE